jgi:hypothetical protein
MIAAACVVLLTGCATGIHVTYSSDPPGATLYQGGQPMGMTPYTLTYQADETFKKGGCMLLQGTNVKWASGATAAIFSLNACQTVGWRQTYMFVRPDVAGRDVDANFALQLQRNGIMQQQNAVQFQQLQQMLTPPKPVVCNSQPWGFGTRTVCN